MNWSSLQEPGGKQGQSELLREVIRSCYKYYGQEHLLLEKPSSPAPAVPTERDDDDDCVQMVNNVDGSVSIITDRAVVTLEDRQNTEVGKGNTAAPLLDYTL